MKKEVILIGAGKSIREGIEKGLWEKIKEKTIWSCNYAFMTMPYLPKRELFSDREFYLKNTNALQAISDEGVEIVARYQSHYEAVGSIIGYQTTRLPTGYKGKQALKTDGTPHIYMGEMSLVGTFALSLAIAEDYDVIYLLGYDFGPTSYEDEDTHYYQGKLDVWSAGMGKPKVYLDKDGKTLDTVTDFKVFTQEKDIQIFNVSLNSNIPFFTKISYETFFTKIKGDKDV